MREEASISVIAGDSLSHFSDFQQHLINALLSSEVVYKGHDGASHEGEQRPQESVGFSSPDFFKKWFRGSGKVFFFLFKRNLRVTNIQVAELLALLRVHVSAEAGTDLQFLSSRDFNESIEKIVQTFPRDKAHPRLRYERIAANYSELLKRAIVFEPNYGSCVVYVPYGLTLDLQSICALSGYIHSCGYHIYIRNVYKATKRELFDRLHEYLGDERKSVLGSEAPGVKVMFRPYSHEDFTASDREIKEELRSGLDDVKVYVEKFFIGKESLASVIEEMRTEFSSTLVIPEPGDYKTKDPKAREGNPGLNRSTTIWLIIDHSVGATHRHPGDRHFFICYEQRYINDNPAHIFDENKPAWIDHTTIPQTLTGAMINLTRPYWPTRSPVRMFDPFVGSGTTWIETLKFPEIDFTGIDVDKMAPLLAEDNALFLSCSRQEAQSYKDQLERIVADSVVCPDPFEEELVLFSEQYRSAMDIFRRLVNAKYSIRDIREVEVNLLRAIAPSDRLTFYLMLRTIKRYAAALNTRSIHWRDAFCKQAGELCGEFRRLCRLKERSPVEDIVSDGLNDVQGAAGRVLILAGEYSLSCSLDPAIFGTAGNAHRGSIAQISCCDILELNERDAYDVIITDPPYGFNVNSGPEHLANLYAKAFEAMIRALKDGGQLVFAVPDWSHTGRQLPAFTHKEFLTHQILVAAEMADKEIFNTAIQMPQGNVQPYPPYYWESERALRRAILHFRFRVRPGYKRAGIKRD
jgi:SAM-dependent methyltransferase